MDCCETEKTEGWYETPLKVSLISFLVSSKGVSRLERMNEEHDFGLEGVWGTYTALSLSLISATEGIELLSLIRACVKSSGSWMFWSPSREGTLNWGAVMSEKGLTLLIPSIAVFMALLTELMSF